MFCATMFYWVLFPFKIMLIKKSLPQLISVAYRVSTEPFKTCSSSLIIVSNFALLSEWWIKEKLIWFNSCFFFFFFLIDSNSRWFLHPSNGLNGDGREMQIHFHKNNEKICPEYFHPYLNRITRSTEKTWRICKGDLNFGRKGLCFGCSLPMLSPQSFLLP